MWRDLTFTWRTLRRYRVYSLASILTLAIGIGASTAIFTVIDATLLRPLPFDDPERLVALTSEQRDSNGTVQVPLSQIELLTWRASSTFEAIEGLESRTVSLTGDGEPAVVQAGAASSGFFRVLGVEPALGRMFSAEEEEQDAAVAVLSHALWADRFGADAGILGGTVTLGGRPHQVVGVMPAGLRLLFDSSTVWTPLHPVIDPARQNNRFMIAIGRLRGGVPVEAARSELVVLNAPLAQQFPISHSRTGPVVEPLHDRLFGQRAPALWMLGAAVLGLLLLSCANVANLTLGHLSSRQGELATRTLLGAGVDRIVWMLLLQTGTLAAVGGALALLGVVVALPPLIALYNGDGLGVVAVGVDWRVVAVGIASVGGTTLLCAVLPAVKVHRASVRGEGQRLAATRFSAGPWERRLRAALVSAQVGIAVALLCASGTLLKSLDAVLAVAPGFARDRVLTLQLMLPPAIYPDAPARASFVRRMLDEVQQVPGVVAAGTTQSTFLPNQTMYTMMYVQSVPTEEPERAHIRHITPGYFPAMRVPVLEGRAIDDRDQMGFPLVCMVSRAFADRYFPDGDALGQRVRRAGGATVSWMTIVGVADDVRDWGLVNEPGPLLYVPYLQLNTPTARVSLVALTQGDPRTLQENVRQAIWRVDRNQPIDRVASLEEVLVEGASAERFRTLLVGLFALVGAILAVVGVYAVTAASVTARTFETSLRLALGARPLGIAGGVIREAALQVAAGLAVGLTLFYLLSGLIARLLYQTSAVDGGVIAGAAAAMSASALLAAAWQSRRLALVSPALGLRGADSTLQT